MSPQWKIMKLMDCALSVQYGDPHAAQFSSSQAVELHHNARKAIAIRDFLLPCHYDKLGFSWLQAYRCHPMAWHIWWLSISTTKQHH
jgi:hypothetical protein